MIGIFDDAGNRLAIDFNDLTLNDPNDPVDDLFEINAVITSGSFDTTIDSDPSGDGAEVSPARKIMYVVRIDGTVRAPTLAKLYDKKRDLSLAFDPSIASRNNPDTHGFTDLDFSVPTTDTAEYASGLIPSRYVARSRKEVVPIDAEYSGTAAFFSAELLVKDPRRVYQTLETLSGAGTANNKGNAPADLTLTITMAGAGSGAYFIRRVGSDTGTKDLTLDLSGLSNGEVVVVDMANRQITVDGADTPSLYSAGDYFDLDPGNNTITYSNTTNATSVLSWRRSWTV